MCHRQGVPILTAGRSIPAGEGSEPCPGAVAALRAWPVVVAGRFMNYPG